MKQGTPIAQNNAHAILGASTAARWLACAGSVRLTRDLPSISGFAADEGSAAHWLADTLLAGVQPPSDFVGLVFQGKHERVEITEEMAEHVKLYVDYVRDLIASHPRGIWGTEQKFSLDKLNPPEPMFGTTDFWLYDPDEYTLYVADLKYGQGVMVEISGNVQTRYYAVGAILALPLDTRIDKIEMTIVQPRKDHEDGFIRSDTITALDLGEFAHTLMDGARLTQDPNAPLVAGDHCRFCPAKGFCPELAKVSIATAQDEFGVTPVLPPPPETLSTAQLSEYLTKLPILDDWSKAVRAHVEELIRNGTPVPGFKLVERRAERVWGDEAKARKQLLEEGMFDIDEKPKIKSVPQIEKLFKGKRKFAKALGEHVVKRSRGYKLVEESHPSPAVCLTSGEEFEALPALGSGENEGEKKGENE